jgi:hypothetical protein
LRRSHEIGKLTWITVEVYITSLNSHFDFGACQETAWIRKKKPPTTRGTKQVGRVLAVPTDRRTWPLGTRG